MKQICPTEQQECIAFVEWVRLQKKIGPYLIHIPNEGARSVRTGANLKRAGLLRGASDYFLAYPSDHYHGLFLEMKRTVKKLSRVSQCQLAFIEQMKEAGYHGDVVYGFDQARELVQRYLNNEKF